MSRHPRIGGSLRIATAHWFVLRLAIEKPSYSYQIAERYARRCGGFLPVGKTAIYSALDRLHRAGLVEPQQIQVGAGVGYRRIRILYAPASEAMGAHECWLLSLIAPERWHQEMLACIGSTYLHGARALQETLDRYAHYADLHQRRIQERLSERAAASRSSLQAALAMLLLQEQQQVAPAQIEWVNDEACDGHRAA